MAFEKGHKPAYVKQKGVKNKRTVEFESALKKHNFNVAEALVYCYTQARAQFENYAQRLEDGLCSPMEDNGWRYLQTASNMAKEIASYVYPKRKAVDVTIDQKTPQESRPLEHLTDEELDKL